MFGAPSRYGARPAATAMPAATSAGLGMAAGLGTGAGARYRDVDVSARVEGASPHQLVSILFEEGLKAIDALIASERGGAAGRAGPQQSRALSILHGLEQGLDYERGGEIATSLGKIYREARRLIGGGGPDRLAALVQARRMLAEIAGAWMSIG